jgi:NAD-dependent deacetylase
VETSSDLLIDDATRVLVLTGAGISAESGVPTFRDVDGLWEGHDVQRVASPQGFASDPALVWRFYAQRRAGMTGVVPNAGHRALVELERRLGDRFLLATQNVDGLHVAAGSERVVELHGNLMTSRCARCDRAPFPDRTAYTEVPSCTACERGLLRPHIVWFGEMLPPSALARIDRFYDDAAGHRLVFLAVGTSGVVYPAAGMVETVRALGGTTWLVNKDAPANLTSFHHVRLGPAGTILPALLQARP